VGAYASGTRGGPCWWALHRLVRLSPDSTSFYNPQQFKGVFVRFKLQFYFHTADHEKIIRKKFIFPYFNL